MELKWATIWSILLFNYVSLKIPSNLFMDIVVKNNPFCFTKDYRAANYLQPLWQLSLKDVIVACQGLRNKCFEQNMNYIYSNCFGNYEIQFYDEYNVLFHFKDAMPNSLFQIQTNYGNVKLFSPLNNCNISRFVLETTLSYINVLWKKSGRKNICIKCRDMRIKRQLK